jgi:hypothetical protein
MPDRGAGGFQHNRRDRAGTARQVRPRPGTMSAGAKPYDRVRQMRWAWNAANFALRFSASRYCSSRD